MKITIEELFTNDEFAGIIDEKWVKQFNKKGNLQSNTKKAIVTKLSKHYASVEYARGTKKSKAGFEIGDKLSVELSNADMIINNIKKSNVAKYKLTAYQIFKNYIAELKNEGVTTQSMTRLQWLRNAGVTSDLKEFWALDAQKIEDRNSPTFIKYYKNDLANYLKSVFEYCVSQLTVQTNEIYYCDCVHDEDADADEDGNKKRKLTNVEMTEYNIKRDELKEKYEVVNFWNAPREFSQELNKYVSEKFKSSKIWSEVEINFTNANIEKVEIDEDELRQEFMSEFRKSRNSLYIKREFRKNNGWRYEALLQGKASVTVPHRQFEERSYYKFMTQLDEFLGFDKADFSEYDKVKDEYEQAVTEIKELFMLKMA